MRTHFSRVWQFRRLLWVAAMSSLPQLQLREKQRQRRRDDARLTESGNARSKQLNTHGAYGVAKQQSLACLSGSERRRPGWFLAMKYQTCYHFGVTQCIKHTFQPIARPCQLAGMTRRFRQGGGLQSSHYCNGRAAEIYTAGAFTKQGHCGASLSETYMYASMQLILHTMSNVWI